MHYKFSYSVGKGKTQKALIVAAAKKKKKKKKKNNSSVYMLLVQRAMINVFDFK